MRSKKEIRSPKMLVLSLAGEGVALSRTLIQASGAAAHVRRARPSALGVRVAGAVRFVRRLRAATARGAEPIESSPRWYEYRLSAGTSRTELEAMLHGLASTSQLAQAVELLRLGAAHPRLRVDERLAGIVLNRCANMGRMEVCEALVDELRAAAVPLGAVTSCIRIKGHGRAGDLKAVRATFSEMKKANERPDLVTCNALLDAHARNGDLRGAEGVLRMMPTLGVSPSVRSWNTLLNGCARARLGARNSARRGAIRRAPSFPPPQVRARAAPRPRLQRRATDAHGGRARRRRHVQHPRPRLRAVRRAAEGERLLRIGSNLLRVRPSVEAYTALIRGFTAGEGLSRAFACCNK